MSIFETKRLILKKWDEEDFEFLYKHYNNEKVVLYMEECILGESKENAKNLINEFNFNFDKNKFSLLKVILKDNNEIIGVSGCYFIKVSEEGRIDEKNDGNIEIELGYDFEPSHWYFHFK
jgi:ribosomal-protein-alanine N-acetyltransferase